MKNKKTIIVLITLLTIITIVLVISMIYLIKGNHNILGMSFNYKTSNNLILDREYENTFSSIIVNSNASDINFNISEDDNIRVVVYGKNDKLLISNKNNELIVDYSEKGCKGFCLNVTIGKIEIYLPKDYENDIVINNNYGDINISDLAFSTIKINEDCGDVKIKSAYKTTIDNKYGDIIIGKVNMANINEDAGDVEIDEVGEANINNKYGDIKLYKVTKYVSIDENCGDIEIDNLNIIENSFIKNSYGDIKIDTTNEIYIDAKVDLGDIKINNNYPKSDIILKIENNLGDIKINN